MIAILFFSAVISTAYIILITRLMWGWNRLPVQMPGKTFSDIPVSVIIAFRNEEKNLPGLFNALAKQSYPQHSIEIVFTDDHSEDGSAELVNEFIESRGNAILVSPGNNQQGKKKALAIAAAESHGELIIFTDADCIPGKDWIRTIVSCYRENNQVLIASPVVVNSHKGFFSRFQALEFLSLMGTTAGAFGAGDPILLNGANFAVKRDIYLDSIGFLQDQTASGDDVFLLLHLKRKFPGRLVFLKSPDATVSIEPHRGIFSFLIQRLRWTSKSRFYNDASIIATATIVLLVNLWILSCLIMSFFSLPYILIGAGVFFVKTGIDYLFLSQVLIFFKKESLLKNFVLSQFLYFLYVSFTGIAGNFLPAKWKGRKV